MHRDHRGSRPELLTERAGGGLDPRAGRAAVATDARDGEATPTRIPWTVDREPSDRCEPDRWRSSSSSGCAARRGSRPACEGGASGRGPVHDGPAQRAEPGVVSAFSSSTYVGRRAGRTRAWLRSIAPGRRKEREKGGAQNGGGQHAREEQRERRGANDGGTRRPPRRGGTRGRASRVVAAASGGARRPRRPGRSRVLSVVRSRAGLSARRRADGARQRRRALGVHLGGGGGGGGGGGRRRRRPRTRSGTRSGVARGHGACAPDGDPAPEKERGGESGQKGTNDERSRHMFPSGVRRTSPRAHPVAGATPRHPRPARSRTSRSRSAAPPHPSP